MGKNRMKKVVIVGGGPAGLFAAYRLCENFNVMIVDMGKSTEKRFCNNLKKCKFCRVCDILSGIGGAGFFSDGKLNFHPQIGGNLLKLMDRKVGEKMMSEVKNILEGFGMKEKIEFDESFCQFLEKKCKKEGIKFVPIKQLHIGSDNLKKIVKNFVKYLKEKGVKFKENTEIKKIVGKKKISYLLTKSNEKIRGDVFLFAVGQVGNRWLASEIRKFGINTKSTGVDIGVRVEIDAKVMKWITERVWEPKFIFDLQRGENSIIRTYCVCPYGYVIREKNGDLVCVNGHSAKRKKSENTNFALMTRIRAKNRPYEYVKSIGRTINALGDGKPILQIYEDFKSNKQSTIKGIKKLQVKPTLKVFKPGNIKVGLPSFLVKNITFAMDKLIKFLGINKSETLIYAPEIKFDSLRVECNNDLSTKVPNLFVAGDGAGVSRGIVIASVTGLLAAKSIKRKWC
jgi:hypothetical protein